MEFSPFLVLGFMIAGIAYLIIRGKKVDRDLRELANSSGERKMIEIQQYDFKIQNHKTSHILHLLMSVVTGGFWIPVWLIVALKNQHKRTVFEREKSTLLKHI